MTRPEVKNTQPIVATVVRVCEVMPRQVAAAFNPHGYDMGRAPRYSETRRADSAHNGSRRVRKVQAR